MKNLLSELRAPLNLKPFTVTPLVEDTSSVDLSQEEHVLQVLVDKSGESIARRIFTTYVSSGDMRRWPSFIIALDKLLSDYGGEPPKPGPKDEDESNDESDDDSNNEESEDEEEEDEIEDDDHIEDDDVASSLAELGAPSENIEEVIRFLDEQFPEEETSTGDNHGE